MALEPERTIWDERIDGALPEGITVGGMVRQGAELVLDPDLLAQHEATVLTAHVQRLQKGIVVAVQKRLDAFAQTRGYDGILSACTYALSAVPKFAAEGQYCTDARDATWAGLYQLLATVQAGNWPTEGAGQMPAGYADIEPELPVLEWPA